MKKMIAVLFYILFFAVYPCKPLITDYLEKAGIAPDSKNLVLYNDSIENFDSASATSCFFRSMILSRMFIFIWLIVVGCQLIVFRDNKSINHQPIPLNYLMLFRFPNFLLLKPNNRHNFHIYRCFPKQLKH